MSDSPPFPERDFDNHEAYRIMERLAADAVAVFPDFPGFERRSGGFDYCEKQGVIYEDWVAIEMRYRFDADISQSDLVHNQYTDVLRDLWTEAGYDIHRDQPNRSGTHYALEARVPGGINLWWSAAGHAGLTIQTGCLPVGNDQRFPEYIAPAGDVPPANDQFGRQLENAPDEVFETDGPADEESDQAAVNPFANVEAAEAPPGRNPFENEL